MIRLAFLGVFVLAGLLAFGAFFLARGDGGSPPQVPVSEATIATPAQAPIAPAADATLLYFLKDIDLTQGPITLVLHDALTGQGEMFVRDTDAIAAAQDVAYVNTSTSGGAIVEMVAMAMMGVAPTDTVAQIYRGDALIGAVVCTDTACGRLAPDRDVNLGPLMDAAQPLTRAQAYFDSFEDYLANIATINATDDYMFLDLAPAQSFPLERQVARMEINLPTLVASAGNTVDPNITSALVRSIVDPLLPDGASIDGVQFSGSGAGVVADKDRGTPVLAGGAPIPFPDVEFTNLRVSVSGAADLSDAGLDSLTQQKVQRTDYADAFATFVRDRLQNPCTDCFTVKMQGDFYEAATITLSEPEGYLLDYYDLREAP